MGCCNFIYNGGFDGSVTIEEKGNEPGKIKGKVKVRVSELEAFIAAKYKQELIGKLEQASDNDILSGRWFSEQILQSGLRKDDAELHDRKYDINSNISSFCRVYDWYLWWDALANDRIEIRD